MRVSCEINLVQCSQHVYYQNSTVSGQIKYMLKEEEEFDSITASLEGYSIVEYEKHKDKSKRWYREREEHVKTGHVVIDSKKKLPAGVYETNFNFLLPPDIPASFKYQNRRLRDYTVDCEIRYNICIKLDFSDLDKSIIFKKEINVRPGITPILPTVPAIFGERKNLVSIFKLRSEVILKVNTEKCFYGSGEIIKLQYEVTNNSHVTIKGVEAKLIDFYTFLNNRFRHENEIPNADMKTGAIKSGKTGVMDIEIQIPEDAFSLENSSIVSREYVVIMIVVLPVPHINLYLKIPVQIGEAKSEIREVEQPPSYWEAMKEVDDKKDKQV